MSVALLPLTTSNCCIGTIECRPVSVAPALEAGLGPIAVGAADVDRAELAQHQQHLVEMVGRGVVGVDQQGDVELGFGIVVSVGHRVFRSCLSGVHTATGSERNRRLHALVAVRGGDECQEDGDDMKRLVLASAMASSIAVTGCAHQSIRLQRSVLRQSATSQGRRVATGAAIGGVGGAVVGAVIPGVSPVDRRGRRRGARRRRRRGDQGQRQYYRDTRGYCYYVDQYGNPIYDYNTRC